MKDATGSLLLNTKRFRIKRRFYIVFVADEITVCFFIVAIPIPNLLPLSL